MVIGTRGATDIDSDGALSAGVFESLRRGIDTPAFHIAQNAVTQVTADDIALNRSVVFTTDHSFSHVLDDWSATNQKQSGRCWMFAGLNLFRAGAMRAMNLKQFEFSQNYIRFWRQQRERRGVALDPGNDCGLR